MTNDPRLRQLLDELLNSHATPEEVCTPCPELLPQVRTRWQAMCRLRADLDALFPAPLDQGSSPRPIVPEVGPLPEVPGYELAGVLGRGGMGVVYRAWHRRLNRPVALKMLLAGSHARTAEHQRFQREAEAVAGLQHPNVVQLYDVGDADGRPYFTMELVEGGSLAKRIQGAPQPSRTAATLVATLASAVHAAHQCGIVHRDLKPGNILLTRDGTPKVTDFGLAWRLEGGTGLTLNGAPVGTPSYMAPEQARVEPGAIGPATDVYALGAILYELLTGRPPFRAASAAATLHQVVADDPLSPSRLNPQIPRDLETICLKCLHKEPPHRYASAAALADDLGRFARDEPIAARPLGRLGRLARWSRRRPTAAGLSGALALAAVLTLTLVGGWLEQDGQHRATAQAAEEDFNEADRLMRQSDLPGARAAVERARGRLGSGGRADLRRRLERTERAIQQRAEEADQARALVARLEAIRMRRAFIVDRPSDPAQWDQEFEEAFRLAGLGTDQEEPAVVAARVGDSPVRTALVSALDYWSDCTDDDRRRAWLLAVARLADPEQWRDRVRDPAAWKDRARLVELTSAAPVNGQPINLLLVLGHRLEHSGADAGPFLWKVQREHPNDIYANGELATHLAKHGQGGIAIGFLRMALALRPDSGPVLHNLGFLLATQNRIDEAIPYLERAIELLPEAAQPHITLADALRRKGRWDQAAAHYREALRIDQKVFHFRHNLAFTLNALGSTDEAIKLYEEEIRLNPRAEMSHFNLAELLAQRGQGDKAAEHYRAAVKINPKFARADAKLGWLLLNAGRADAAADHLRQAVALEPKNPEGQKGLRAALIRQGRPEEARAAWRKWLDNGPPEHDAWFGYAELSLYLGHEDDYRRHRWELLVRFGSTKDPTVAELTGRACLLLPGTKEEMKDAATLTDRAVAAGRKEHERSYPYYIFAKGLADYRRERFADALAAMRGEAAKVLGPCPRLVTAMTLFRTEQKEEASKELEVAIASFDWNPAKAHNHEHWIAHILRREAETLIQPDRPELLNGKSFSR